MSSISENTRHVGAWAPKSPAYGGSIGTSTRTPASSSISSRLPKEKTGKSPMLEAYLSSSARTDHWTPASIGSRR